MSKRIARRSLVTIWNLLWASVIGFGLVDDYRLYLSSPIKPPRTALDTLIPILLVCMLLLGVVFEWLDYTWLALSLNAGPFALFSLLVLGKVAIVAVSTPAAQYDPEAGLVVEIA